MRALSHDGHNVFRTESWLTRISAGSQVTGKPTQSGLSFGWGEVGRRIGAYLLYIAGSLTTLETGAEE
jgi:hypothetical protein